MLGLVTILWKYSAMAPTFLSMDHSLSLSTTIRRLVCVGDVVQRLERDAVGEGGIAGHGDDVFLAAGQSRATAMPSAAESAVPACPAP